MDQFKSWFASTGVWGGIVSALAGLLGVLGYTLTPDDQVQIVNTMQQTYVIIMSLASLGGGMLAVYGRVKASKKIAA